MSLVALAMSAVACTHVIAQDAPDAWRNAALPFEERARDLVSRLTLEEKAAQLGHAAPGIPRLGVPEYNWWNEGLHGVARAGIATVFPQAIGMAATFDESLTRQTADIIATEFRAKHVETKLPDGGSGWYRGLTVWSPNINIFRDPRWGRGQETYGEDPYLTARLGVAFIRGLQGDDPKYLKTVATSKHYAVHSGPESNRHKEDVHPSAHDLEDTYLPAFRASIIEGRAESVMCAYNAVDGIPACASEFLMQQRLRQDWGFKGYVVSDCGAAANIFREDSLHYKPTDEEGVAAGFAAGMDLICGDYRNDMSTEPEGIVRAVRKGLLPEAVLDRALQRLMLARFRLGMFDVPASLPFAHITAADNDSPAHRAHAQRMAEKSLVLLKNDGLLPVRKAPGTIAVIGPNADSVDALLGNYNGDPSAPVTVLAGIRKRFANSKVVHAEGTGLIGPVTRPVPAQVLCLDAACESPGLHAENYEDRRLAGPPLRELTTETASVDWTVAGNTGVRWSGFIKAPESGEYRFGFVSLDGYRVWVNNQLVIDDWTQRDAASLSTGRITLEAGRVYPIKVEAFQKGRRFSAQLVWSLPSARGDDAVEAAKAADLVVMVMGLSARVEGEEMKVLADGFAGGDRTRIDLPVPQQQLLERVHAVGKPVVLVLMNGSALAVNWAHGHVSAIVEAWYPGQAGGDAVAGLIAGDFSPAGRLPVTFYKSVEELPPFADYAMANRTYRYFTGAPLYPFGHGLSYARFEYAKARARAEGGLWTVSVDVRNRGRVASDEVTQLYVSHPGIEGAPLRALKGFQRLHLAAGERRTLTFRLTDRDLATVDAEGTLRLRPGTVAVWVGGGQPHDLSHLPRVSGARTRIEQIEDRVLPR
jgi:beta-glucosidase